MEDLVDHPLDFFKGKRVFVTGHTGFKGAWLAYWLHLLGAEVYGYALSPTVENSLFSLLKLEERIMHRIGDVRNYDYLYKEMRRFEPEFVFHLAAQSLVVPSYSNPRETYEINVQGAVNLLEAVRQLDCVRSLIYVTSDKCYLNKEWIWAYREIDELGGHDPYSSSKACAEMVFNGYYASFFQKMTRLGVGSVRAGNVIGGGDWSPFRIIPDFVRAMMSNKVLELRRPDAIRPWQHVLEPLYGYLQLAMQLYKEPSVFSGAWNFGPDYQSQVTVRDLIEHLIAACNKGAYEVVSSTPLEHEATFLKLDCSKSKQFLGWHPQLGFEKTIKLTAEWYQSFLAGASIPEITSSQISEYAQLIKAKSVTMA